VKWKRQWSIIGLCFVAFMLCILLHAHMDILVHFVCTSCVLLSRRALSKIESRQILWPWSMIGLRCVQAESGQVKWKRRWSIIGLCFVAFMLCNMDRVNMSIAILPMAQQYGWDSTTVGLVQSSFFWYAPAHTTVPLFVRCILHGFLFSCTIVLLLVGSASYNRPASCAGRPLCLSVFSHSCPSSGCYNRPCYCAVHPVHL
jgi:hypothetical protein